MKFLSDRFYIAILSIGVLLALSVLGAVAYLLLSAEPQVHEQMIPEEETQTTTPEHVEVAIPPFTEAVQQQLAASDGFEVLISYTNRGFEPMNVEVHVGDTVRFANNSDHNLWVASSGSAPVCGDDVLNSCKAVGRGEFWEVTFNDLGIWQYQNLQNVYLSGSVTVVE